MTNRTFMMLSGIVLIIGGILAAVAPFAASVAVALLVGWAFIIAGCLHIFEAFRDSDDRLWNGFFGALSVLLGLSFVFNPLGGLISLAILLGVLFFGSGIMQLYLAWKRRAQSGIWLLALSGVISVILAFLIAFNIPTAAATLPGFILAIELISTGVALLVLRKGLAGSKASEFPAGDRAENPTARGTTSPVEMPEGPEYRGSTSSEGSRTA